MSRSQKVGQEHSIKATQQQKLANTRITTESEVSNLLLVIHLAVPLCWMTFLDPVLFSSSVERFSLHKILRRRGEGVEIKRKTISFKMLYVPTFFIFPFLSASYFLPNSHQRYVLSRTFKSGTTLNTVLKTFPLLIMSPS
jgi:hypothetical protein